jgi:hypothetical protein
MVLLLCFFCETRLLLLADTKATENLTQQVIRRETSSDFGQFLLRQPALFGHHIQKWLRLV